MQAWPFKKGLVRSVFVVNMADFLAVSGYLTMLV